MSDIVERLRNVDLLDDFARLEAADEIERLHQEKDEAWKSAGIWQQRYYELRAATIEECEVTISDVFASTSPRDYMMNGAGSILKRMIDALHALKERQT